MNVAQVLKDAKTIAIVGMSDKRDRASNEVARYLMPYYRVIPVNPNHSEIEGVKCYPDLESIPDKVDIVDVFQRSENVIPFVEPAIRMAPACFWMQLGIRNQVARDDLEAAGIYVVEDLCTKIEHMRYIASNPLQKDA